MSTIEGFPSQFRARVLLSSTPGCCWIWTGRHVGHGYPAFDGGRALGQYAHRAAWIMQYGPLPTGARVAHRCGNRLCVRPDHLVLMPSRQDRAGRWSRGAANPNARLTDFDVARIREAVGRGQYQVEVARLFRVSQPLVSAIVRRRRWRHVA